MCTTPYFRLCATRTVNRVFALLWEGPGALEFDDLKVFDSPEIILNVSMTLIFQKSRVISPHLMVLLLKLCATETLNRVFALLWEGPGALE